MDNESPFILRFPEPGQPATCRRLACSVVAVGSWDLFQSPNQSRLHGMIVLLLTAFH